MFAGLIGERKGRGSNLAVRQSVVVSRMTSKSSDSGSTTAGASSSKLECPECGQAGVVKWAM